MKTKVYNQAGKETGEINLPESVFNVAWNGDMVHQVITSLMTNKRSPTAHSKDRGEVRGGGKKPWRQKGTGRARHGSIRSPLWPGGGVTHGPLSVKNFSRKVNKKTRIKALFAILSKKFTDGEVLFVDEISFAKPSTAEAKIVLKKLNDIKGFEGILSKKNNAAYIALSKKDGVAEKSLRNFNNMKADELRNINPVDIMNYKYVVITNPAESVKYLESKIL
ncbi:MAG: 50S ribosomal protein L4 [Candidatus Paceibacterota bacterium]